MEQPQWTDDEFDEEIRSLVTDTAPRVFAVVQVYGEREDGRVAAWGFAHDDEEGGEVFDVVGVEGNVRLRLRSLARLGRYFARDPLISVRVEWVPWTLGPRGFVQAA
jgi:hypothetical protein